VKKTLFVNKLLLKGWHLKEEQFFTKIEVIANHLGVYFIIIHFCKLSKLRHLFINDILHI